MSRPVVIVLVLLLTTVCVARSLSLAGRKESREGEREESVKRDGRRITRGRYRMGYMFGKRSDMEDNTAGLLIKSLTGKAISVDNLATALHSDAALAERVAEHLDKNDDGYVSVSELL